MIPFATISVLHDVIDNVNAQSVFCDYRKEVGHSISVQKNQCYHKKIKIDMQMEENDETTLEELNLQLEKERNQSWVDDHREEIRSPINTQAVNN